MQIKSFLICLLIIVVLDYLFVKKVAYRIYLSELSHFARKDPAEFSPRSGPALLVYVLLAGGAVMLAYLSGKSQTALQSLGSGALFGFLVYGFYDMTNFAILAKWSFKLSMIDIAWGTMLNAGISLLLHFMM